MNKKVGLFIGIALILLVISIEVFLHTQLIYTEYILNEPLFTILIIAAGLFLLTSVILVENYLSVTRKGKKSNKNKFILWSILLIFVFYHFIFGYRYILDRKMEKQIEYNISQVYNSGNKEINLTEVIPFEWDRAYSITPFSTEEVVMEITGEDYKQIKRTRYIEDNGLSEMYSFIFFFKDDKLIFAGCSWYLIAYPIENENNSRFCFEFFSDEAYFRFISFSGYKYEMEYYK